MNDLYYPERSDTMFRLLFIVLALSLVVLIGIRQFPALQRDIQRYIEMRNM